MWLQSLHLVFLFLQWMVGWKFLVQGLEVNPDVVQRLGLTDADRKIYPYLTVWNLVFHIVYIVLCVMEDVILGFSSHSKLSKLKKDIQKLRCFMFESIVFPGSLVVCTLYWSLTLMDPLYLFPGPIEDLIPAWINFFIHSGVGIFAIGELLLRPQMWALDNRKYHAMVGVGVMLLYGIIICIHYFSMKKWIYPFVELLSWPQRLCFFFSMIFTGLVYYMAGSYVNALLHGKSPRKPMKRGQKKTQKKKKN